LVDRWITAAFVLNEELVASDTGGGLTLGPAEVDLEAGARNMSNGQPIWVLSC
jgi:hypothetical protein